MTFTGQFRPVDRSRASAERYGRAVLDGVCADLRAASSGRNALLNAGAFRCGQIAREAGLDDGEIERALLDAAASYVLKHSLAAARATFLSGFRRGLAEPRDLPPPSQRHGSSPEVRPEDPAETAQREQARELARLAQQAEDQIKGERARRLWERAVDPRGTLVERYLAVHRGLDLPDGACGHTVRFIADGQLGSERGPLMVCSFRDFHTDQVVGVHRTLLNPATAAKLGRGMLGRAKGAAIMLSPNDTVTHGLFVAEGVESALAGMMIGLCPMWALGSTVNIKSFPVLSGIESLTICGEAGEASAKVVEECGARWTAAGREVRVSVPRSGSDLNDSLREAA